MTQKEIDRLLALDSRQRDKSKRWTLDCYGVPPTTERGKISCPSIHTSAKKTESLNSVSR